MSTEESIYLYFQRSIIIMAKSVVASRHSTGEVTESYSSPDPQAGRERLGLAWTFQIPKSSPSDTLPPVRLYPVVLLILANKATSWHSVYEHIWAILF